MAQSSRATFPAVWRALERLAKENDEIIDEVIRTDHHPSCATVGGCPNGYHLRWRRADGRLRAVSFRTIQNFVRT